MNICLFRLKEIGKPLFINDARACHIIKVLHKKVGDTFNCGIIEGKRGIATITSITKDNLCFDFVATADDLALLPLSIIVGFTRPVQLRRLLRDMAALGVRELHITHMDTGEKSYMQSSIASIENLNALLLEGAMQAGVTHIPKVHIYESLDSALLFFSKDMASTKVALDNVKAQEKLCDYIKNATPPVIAVIGSERGFSDRERCLLLDNDFVLCSMGERIMRTETACTVASTIILEKLGAF